MLFYTPIKVCRREDEGRLGEWCVGCGGTVIATCHFIQLHFNLGCLEESQMTTPEEQWRRWEVEPPRFEQLIPRNKSPGYELFAF